MAKNKKEKKKAVKEPEDDFWTDELADDEAPAEEIDSSKLKFTKIRDLKPGMEGVNVRAAVDFVGEIQGKSYGDDPFAMGFLKDETGEVKITFWGDDIAKARSKKEVVIIDCYVSEFRGQTQLQPRRKRGIEFV